MGIAEEIEKIARPLLAEAGVELVAAQYQREPPGWVLRLLLDKAGGISLDDCADWSRRLGDTFEQSGLLPGAYALEVSSPGLNRPLRKREDFERYAGLDAVVKLFAPINHQRNFHGAIQGIKNDALVLLDRTNGLVALPIQSIASAKLDPPIDV